MSRKYEDTSWQVVWEMLRYIQWLKGCDQMRIICNFFQYWHNWRTLVSLGKFQSLQEVHFLILLWIVDLIHVKTQLKNKVPFLLCLSIYFPEIHIICMMACILHLVYCFVMTCWMIGRVHFHHHLGCSKFFFIIIIVSLLKATGAWQPRYMARLVFNHSTRIQKPPGIEHGLSKAWVSSPQKFLALQNVGRRLVAYGRAYKKMQKFSPRTLLDESQLYGSKLLFTFPRWGPCSVICFILLLITF